MVRASKQTMKAAAQPPPHAIQRSRPDASLVMECEEEELTPSQIAANQRLMAEYREAEKKIAEARRKATEEFEDARRRGMPVPAADSVVVNPYNGGGLMGVGGGMPGADNIVSTPVARQAPIRTSRPSKGTPEVIVLDDDDDDDVAILPSPSDFAGSGGRGRGRGRPPKTTVVIAPPTGSKARGRPRNPVNSPLLASVDDRYYSPAPIGSAYPAQGMFQNVGMVANQGVGVGGDQMFVMVTGVGGVSQRIIIPKGATPWPVVPTGGSVDTGVRSAGKAQTSKRTSSSSSSLSLEADAWNAINQVMRPSPSLTHSPAAGPQVGKKGAKKMVAAILDTPTTEEVKKRGRKKLDVLEKADTDGDDDSGTWVPLDEFYYGRKEGDPGYREEKGEYRFKCWYCHQMLYNNLRLMLHMQGHIDTEKKEKFDLSDLTQCTHCYEQFDTQSDLQRHVEKVHENKSSVLVCRICEKEYANQSALRAHMTQLHHACEMPYICQLCSYRSSVFTDVVDHFKKRHDSSQFLLCLYCLKTVQANFASKTEFGRTQHYYQHLQKHLNKGACKKCKQCKLSFLSKAEAKVHQGNDHTANCKGILAGASSLAVGVEGEADAPPLMVQVGDSSNAKVKLLNAPAAVKMLQLRGLRISGQLDSSVLCLECKKPMNSIYHYRNYVQCALCRFATTCGDAYSSHMRLLHSGKTADRNAVARPDKRMPQPVYCLCGFSSAYGTHIAVHLVSCSKRTCYPTLPETRFIEYDDEQVEEFNPFEPVEPDDDDGPHAIIPADIVIAGIMNDILDTIFPGERAAADCLADLLVRVDQTVKAKQARKRSGPKSRKLPEPSAAEKWAAVKLDRQGDGMKSIFGDDSNDTEQSSEPATKKKKQSHPDVEDDDDDDEDDDNSMTGSLGDGLISGLLGTLDRDLDKDPDLVLDKESVNKNDEERQERKEKKMAARLEKYRKDEEEKYDGEVERDDTEGEENLSKTHISHECGKDEEEVGGRGSGDERGHVVEEEGIEKMVQEEGCESSVMGDDVPPFLEGNNTDAYIGGGKEGGVSEEKETPMEIGDDPTVPQSDPSSAAQDAIQSEDLFQPEDAKMAEIGFEEKEASEPFTESTTFSSSSAAGEGNHSGGDVDLARVGLDSVWEGGEESLGEIGVGQAAGDGSAAHEKESSEQDSAVEHGGASTCSESGGGDEEKGGSRERERDRGRSGDSEREKEGERSGESDRRDRERGKESDRRDRSRGGESDRRDYKESSRDGSSSRSRDEDRHSRDDRDRYRDDRHSRDDRSRDDRHRDDRDERHRDDRHRDDRYRDDRHKDDRHRDDRHRDDRHRDDRHRDDRRRDDGRDRERSDRRN